MWQRAFGVGLGVTIASFVLAGCAQSSAPALSSGEVTIKATEFKFEPGNVSVEAGKLVKLTLRNDGKIDHNVSIPGINVDGKELQLNAKAGETASVQFTPDKAGTFDLACTLPAHRDAGMTGKFVVAAATGR